jgi:hypothetical protein
MFVCSILDPSVYTADLYSSPHASSPSPSQSPSPKKIGTRVGIESEYYKSSVKYSACKSAECYTNERHFPLTR